MTHKSIYDELARITREAFVDSLYRSIMRPSPFEFSEGRLMLRRQPWWRRVSYVARRRVRNAWWALRDRLPDEENWTEWL